MCKKTTFLFGLGPHAKRIYIPYLLESENIEKIVCVDLKEKEGFLSEYKYSEKLEFIFFENIDKDAKSLNNKSENLLFYHKKKFDIKHAIIATEPKSHLKYAKWCLENDINILCDKPITTPAFTNTQLGSNSIISEYNELLKLYSENENLQFEIQTQRRFHKGFKIVWEEVNKIVDKYEVPITKLKISHCDGTWSMPNEFIEKENHPYKYGYGKLMHSGYHFIDLMNYFIDINRNAGFIESYRKIHHSEYKGSDFYKNYSKDFYEKLNYNVDSRIFEDKNYELLRNFGELDILSSIEMLDSQKDVITLINLDLSQTGFSNRSWSTTPLDTYKGNGRTRHELFEITVGPLLNIKVLSFQGENVNTDIGYINQAGRKDHFEIQIYRNAKLIGGKTFEKIELNNIIDKKYIGQNEIARFELLDRFFAGEKTISNIRNHWKNIEVLAEMYRAQSLKCDTNFRVAIECILLHKDKILFGKRSKAASVAPNVWNIPAGKVQFNETIESALYREVFEETNLQISSVEYLNYNLYNEDDYKRIVYTYFSQIDQIDNLSISDEFDDYKWMSLEEIKNESSISPYLKKTIQSRIYEK